MSEKPGYTARSGPSWPALPWPVFLVAGLMFAGLLAVSGAYGFHRDEMYFIVAGRHPTFGYADQPPLTPLLTAVSAALLGVSPTAVRLLPALEMAIVVILTALIARDLGGSRRAQVLAAATAALSGYLLAGHLDDTAEFDLLAWAVILWLLVKLLAAAIGVSGWRSASRPGSDSRTRTRSFSWAPDSPRGCWWPGAADVVRSPWAWSAIGIAVILWAPNLIWQAANGWPQLALAAHIADQAGDNRAQLLRSALALHRAAPVPSLDRWRDMGSEGEGCGAMARDRDCRHRRDRSGVRQRGQGVLRGRHRARVHGRGRDPPRRLAVTWPASRALGDRSPLHRRCRARSSRIWPCRSSLLANTRRHRSRLRSPTRPNRSAGRNSPRPWKACVSTLPADQRSEVVSPARVHGERLVRVRPHGGRVGCRRLGHIAS